MNWEGIAALVSIGFQMLAIAMIYGKFSQRITDNCDRVIEHAKLLNEHDARLNAHDVQLATSIAWHEGFTAAMNKKSPN